MTLHTRVWDEFCKVYKFRSVQTVTDIVDTGILYSLMRVGRVNGDEVQYEADYYSTEGQEPLRHNVHLIPSRSLYSEEVNGIAAEDTLGEFLQTKKLTSQRLPSMGLGSPLSLVYFDSFPDTWGELGGFWRHPENDVYPPYPRHFEIADERYLRVISYAGESMDTAREVFEIVIDLNVPIVYYKCRHLDECIDSFWKLRSLTIISRNMR